LLYKGKKYNITFLNILSRSKTIILDWSIWNENIAQQWAPSIWQHCNCSKTIYILCKSKLSAVRNILDNLCFVVRRSGFTHKL